MPVRGFRPPNRRYESADIVRWKEQTIVDDDTSPRLRKRARQTAATTLKVGEAHNVPHLASKISLCVAISASDIKSCINNPREPLYSSFSQNEVFNPAADDYLVLRRKLLQQARAEQRRQSVLSAREHRNTAEDTRRFHAACHRVQSEDRRVRARDNETIERIVHENDGAAFSTAVLETAAASFDHHGEEDRRPSSAAGARSAAGHSGSRPTSARLIPRSSVIAASATLSASARGASSNGAAPTSALLATGVGRPNSARGVFPQSGGADASVSLTIDEIVRQKERDMRKVAGASISTSKRSSIGADGVDANDDDDDDADNAQEPHASAGASARPRTAPAERSALQQLRERHGWNSDLRPTFVLADVAEELEKTISVNRKAMLEASLLRRRVVAANARHSKSGDAPAVGDENAPLHAGSSMRRSVTDHPLTQDDHDDGGFPSNGEDDGTFYIDDDGDDGGVDAAGRGDSFFVTQTEAERSFFSTRENLSMVEQAAGASGRCQPRARRAARYPSGNNVPTPGDLLQLIAQCNAEKERRQQQQQQQQQPAGAFKAPSRPSTARVYSCRAAAAASAGASLRQAPARNTIEEFERRSSTATVPFVRGGAVDSLQEWLKLSPRGGGR